MTTIEQAKEVLKIEAQGLLDLIDKINEKFSDAIDLICKSKGRVIVSGIGKSGIIGRKIVATLNSTGTRSLFLHPVEAMHGDLGMVDKKDVFLALSYSGETDELNLLLPNIRKMGCPIIAFTGKLNSTLAQNSDITIDVGVLKEACPMGLAPTTSSTAMLAMGDALAVVLIHKHNFKSNDFKKLHPGGSLGQRLSMKVNDLMMTDEKIPKIIIGSTMQQAIAEINRTSLGVTLVADHENILLGIITDGDIRRILAKQKTIHDLSVDSVMTNSPHSMTPESPAYDALNLMEQHEITILPIVDNFKKIKGIIHLHDILGKGEFKFYSGKNH